MSVYFSALNSRVLRRTPFGDRPTRLDLGERLEFVGFASVPGRAILELLGLANDELLGEASLPEFRRALIRARAIFDRRAPEFVEETRTEYGRPIERDGVVEMRPVRAIYGGVDLEGLERRLALLEDFTAVAVAAGATDINWG